MKNPSFGSLHNPLPSQSEMQGRKKEEEIQQPVFSHGYAKISHCMKKFRGRATAGLSEGQILHTVRNFTHHAKPQEAAKIISYTMRNFAQYAKSSYAPTPLDFYLQIFCVTSYFLLVINLDILFYIFLYLFV